MGYVACPQCGNLNRDTDTSCYSCSAELVPPPPPPPEAPPAEAAPDVDDPWAANRDIRVQPLSPKSGGDPNSARFKDLASRYEAKPVPKLNSTPAQGLRAGLPAGLVAGVLMGMYRQQNPDELTRLLVRRMPKLDKKGSTVLGYSIGFDLFLGLLIGGFLGLSNLLCFTPEACVRGAILGAMASAVLIYLAGTSYFGLVLGALNGFVIALLASLIERKLFRTTPKR